jgi:hypothetical protein
LHDSEQLTTLEQKLGAVLGEGFCMSTSNGESLAETEGGGLALDQFPDLEVEFALEASELLAGAQIIDDLQSFPAVFDSGAGKVAVLGGSFDEDTETLTLLSVVIEEPNVRLTLGQLKAVADQCLRLYRHAGRIAKLSKIPLELQEFCRRIEVNQDHISVVRIVLVTRGVAPAKTLDDYVIEGTIVRTELFDGVPPVSGKLSAAPFFLYFSGGRDRTMTWDIHRNARRLC